MKTVTKEMEIFLHVGKYNTDRHDFFTCDMSEYGHVLVSSKVIEVSIDIPEDFDVISAQVESFEAEKKKIEAEAFVKVENINDQIQRLLCIEHTVETAE